MTTDDSITDILIPTDTDKEPIKWDDNDATLEGVLHEIYLLGHRSLGTRFGGAVELLLRLLQLRTVSTHH